ncbi:MAG TPA: aminopeptidase P family N-terminal domain-containing protein, partial [Bryobacteraceae bacterium]
MNRRNFLTATAVGVAQMASAQRVPEAIRNLRPMTGGIQPVTDDERHARMEKARRLMRENKIGAIVLEGGSSLFYYTGTRWPQSDRTFAWVLPAAGEPVWIVPEGDRDRARRAIRMGSDLRTWKEDESPYKKVAQALKDRGGAERVGLEERVRFAVFDGLRKEAPGLEFVSGDPVTVGCRVIKSPAEIALLQRANDITLAAYKAAFPTMHEGMPQQEL